ncbi:MAG TPA: hypothetical protein VFF27_16135 [Bacteroidia bacterium]|jgi:hypothetical protein|nr:hypothetical protein [Bacteroidia bacterium]
MTSNEIYNDIKKLLDTFPNNKSFKLGCSKDARLTWQYSKCNVWHPLNILEAGKILKKLCSEYGLEFKGNDTGKYIYVDNFRMNNFYT